MSEITRFLVVLTAIAAAIAVPILLLSWYAAGVQVEVYRRQGVEMTQWEVFVGAKPVERTIQHKGSKVDEP